MAWKERDWHPACNGSVLVDCNGNADPTGVVGGRVIGGWSQRRGGKIVYGLLEDVGAEADAAVEAEAARLQAWFGEIRIKPGFLPPFQRARSR